MPVSGQTGILISGMYHPCVNFVTHTQNCVMHRPDFASTFVLEQKTNYVTHHCSTRPRGCWRHPLADQYLYSDGSENQKYTECRGSDYRGVMAVESFWIAGFPWKCKNLIRAG